MKTAKEFENKESISVPANHILAIVRDSQAKNVVEALARAGLSADDMGVLTGRDDAEKLNAATGKEGFFAKMLTSGVDMGDRDTKYIEQYRNALLDGRTVIGVLAKSDEARDKIRNILKGHGGRFITFFGTFVTEVLEA
jgi:hypothetical protein